MYSIIRYSVMLIAILGFKNPKPLISKFTMRHLIINQFTCLALLLNGAMLHAQPESVKRPIAGHQVHNKSISGRPLLKQSSTMQGNYVLKPDEKGQQDFDTTLANNLQQALETIYATYPVGGLSAAALVPGKGMWLGATGYSTVEPLDSISPDMIFDLCGIEQPILSAMMLLLAQDGELSLDDSIGMYLPDLPATISGQITIFQLLSMTSGLYDYFWENYTAIQDSIHSNPDHIWTFDEIISRWVGPPYSEPGSNQAYSNTNIVLAYEIIRNVMQTSASEQFHNRICKPLSIERIYFTPEDTLVGPAAHPWVNESDIWDIYSSNANLSLLLSTFSTAENITRYVNDLFTGQVINLASLDQLIYPTDREESGIGLCIWREKILGKTVWDYVGTTLSSLAIFFYFPQSGFCYSVLGNNDGDWVQYWSNTQLIGYEYLKTIPVASAAEPGVLYALSSNNNGLLCKVNTTSLDLGTLGPVSFTEPHKIKVHPLTGDLWGLFNEYSTLGWQLVKFDGVTGEAFPRVKISISEADDFSGMDFAPDGTLYLTSRDGKIFTVDTITGAGTLLVTSPVKIGSMAIEPETGEVWATARMGTSRNPRIFKINLENGDTLGIGNADLDQLVSDIAFDAQGNLFGIIEGLPSRLVNLDVAKGKGTEIKTYDTTDIMSITFSSGAVIDIPSILAEDQQDRFNLDQNYPNPFSNSTSISFGISDNDYVSLKIYTIDGREVATLVNEELRPGSYKRTWDAHDFSDGLYFYTLKVGFFTESRKMVLMR
jgi:CubicO group peptidase (beta-lactamase class C family)